MNTQCTCPVCNGTTRKPAGDTKYKQVIYGYDKANDTLICNNCGGQTMWGKPTGMVYARKDNGQPCVHEYTREQRGRSYVTSTCKHCGYSYDIDSGD
jgi:rubredoxin